MLQPKNRPGQDSHYAMRDIPSPVVSGRSLDALVNLLESVPFLRRSVLTHNHMQFLRKKVYSDVPSLLPYPPQDMAELEKRKQQEQSAPVFPMSPSDPVATLETTLAAIQASSLQAVIELDEKSAREAAEASRLRFEKGQPLSALDGVPIVIKSEIFVQGLQARAGTSFLTMPAQHPEATLVTRLREAGAVIVGLTNMHEIGIGVTGFNRHWGTVRNPYDPERHSGGSSSGSAAAVAAHLVPIAIGTDGGGSIRIPSSLCGVVGLKPTFSRVPSQGIFPCCVSVSQAGPIARTARDCALTYQIIAAGDFGPPPSLRNMHRTDDLSDLTVGVYRPWFQDADPEVVAVCDEMLMALQKRGLKRVDIRIPELEEVRLAHFATIAAEMHSFIKPHLATQREKLALTTRFALALGSEISTTDYLQAQRVRTRAMNHLADIFREVDVIVSPTCAVVAPLIQSQGADRLDTVLMGQLMRFAQLYNLTGNPGISFPAGYSQEGLPIGIQFGARWWAEADLLRLALAAEELLPYQPPRNLSAPIRP